MPCVSAAAATTAGFLDTVDQVAAQKAYTAADQRAGRAEAT